MKAMLILIIAVLGAGCAAQPNYGAPFDVNVHGAAEPEAGKLIAYRWNNDFSNRYQIINIGSVRTALLAKDGFVQQSLPPGEHTIIVGAALADLSVSQGEVTYLQIGEEMTRKYVECEIQKHTALLCAQVRIEPTLAVVDAATALPRLAQLREICNDC